jgi:hypothetical protein
MRVIWPSLPTDLKNNKIYKNLSNVVQQDGLGLLSWGEHLNVEEGRTGGLEDEFHVRDEEGRLRDEEVHLRVAKQVLNAGGRLRD